MFPYLFLLRNERAPNYLAERRLLDSNNFPATCVFQHVRSQSLNSNFRVVLVCNRDLK